MYIFFRLWARFDCDIISYTLAYTHHTYIVHNNIYAYMRAMSLSIYGRVRFTVRNGVKWCIGEECVPESLILTGSATAFQVRYRGSHAHTRRRPFDKHEMRPPSTETYDNKSEKCAGQIRATTGLIYDDIWWLLHGCGHYYSYLLFRMLAKVLLKNI